MRPFIGNELNIRRVNRVKSAPVKAQSSHLSSPYGALLKLYGL